MKINQIFRSLLKDRLNTSVIIISLAIGLTCINLIILFINKELKTDGIQTNADRIYLLKCDNPFNKGSKMFACIHGGAEYMKENFAQVEDYCRINPANVQKVVADNQSYYGNTILYEASTNFFTFFTYNLLTKNPESVLAAKGDIAISEDLAKKYFGTSSAVGKMITLTNGDTKIDYIIKGIFRKPLVNSQLSFDFVTFVKESDSYAFLLLKENTDPSALEKIFAGNKAKIPNINAGTPGIYYLENFRQAYFDTTQRAQLGPVRDKSDIWIALIIGTLILGVASFNYLGLINNKLLDKAHEFYIRRINGGSKIGLIANFMLENLIVIGFAFILSLIMLNLAIPFFNDLTKSDIRFRYFFQTDKLLIMLVVIAFMLMISLLFSFVRINFQSISSTSRVWLNNKGKIIQIPVFNILQLTVSLILLICSLIIVKQIKYIKDKDIGIDKEVIEVKLPDQYSDKTSVFKEEILKNSAVNLVSVTSASPLQEHWSVLYQYTQDGEEKQYTPSLFKGDENYISTLGIRLINGRNFSGNIESDKNNCLINESLARKFPDQNLIGLKLPGDNDLTIIGIVKDFNFSSLKKVIKPCIILFRKNGNHLLVKASADKLSIVRNAIINTWQKIIADNPPDIELLRDRYEWYHRENSNYAKLTSSCCIISLFLSMIGLFAISFNSGRKRTKEIGLRKVNGATIPEILLLLNRDFFRWVVIAFIIASPVAWYSMHKWLTAYAYKTEMNWSVFATAGAILIIVSLFTISRQSWVAATRNPIEALRDE
jgi:putative ABC transport system permease protein